MIAYLKGLLIHKSPSEAIVDCGGVGYRCIISLFTYEKLPNIEQPCLLYTHFHIREDAHLLYGFADVKEKNIFQMLISVNGVGPATAINILSASNPAELHSAIIRSSIQSLQSIKGIGPKTAQRIILELKDKLGKDAGFSVENSGSSIKRDAMSALQNMGFTRMAAEQTIEQLFRQFPQPLTLEEIIRLALKAR
ncbi:MAG: Holliday junction DNA helicase RuvA [Bacteroidetes bacterium RIFCSPLOWO2_02_FULL_36_8]|nr:MAG: Holliday junction DNA helicase RuvA [Bacteroidetes bacterium RIFCSPLOWO2_02_FULL_36_8]OFY71268.1 MAG: Holliday junction DNA helicase RuvA [Bacteroidetes bacterium RIFCSPLOWO2_12_FULL_37_12]